MPGRRLRCKNLSRASADGVSLCEMVTFRPFSKPRWAGVFGAAEELVGSFSPCSEWFVLRSSSLFLVGPLQQMSEPCIDARSYLAVFVLVLIVLCSVLFLIPRRSSGADVRSYTADGGASWQIFSLF